MDAFFIALLVWCSNTDIRKRTVPNLSVALMLCLGIVHTVVIALAGITWWTYPAGMVFAIPFFIAWLKDSMGAGDVKLVIAITLYLGLLNAVIAFALMIPVLAGLIIKSLIQKKILKCQIPFAPVLTIGAFGAILTGYLYALMNI
jgi:Flp pilus assembly protein protease CpaA